MQWHLPFGFSLLVIEETSNPPMHAEHAEPTEISMQSSWGLLQCLTAIAFACH
jgi:hypothetical protein